MDSGATDGHLVREVIAGRRQAFDELIRRHQRQAFAVSYRLLGRSEDALEVTQNSFLKAFTSIGTLQQPEAFAGWLMRIVSNLSLNYRRGRKSNQQLPLDDLLETGGGDLAGANDDPSRRLAGQEVGSQLQKAGAVAGEAEIGADDVYGGSDAAEGGGRGTGLQRGSSEVACISGEEEIEGTTERLSSGLTDE